MAHLKICFDRYGNGQGSEKVRSENKRSEKKIIFNLGRHGYFLRCSLPLYFADIIANKIRLLRLMF